MVDFNLGTMEIVVEDSAIDGATLTVRMVSVDGVLINEFTGVRLQRHGTITVSFGDDMEDSPTVPKKYSCPLCQENGNLAAAAYDLQTGYIRLYKCYTCSRRWTEEQLTQKDRHFNGDAPPALEVKARDDIGTKDKFGG